MSSSSKLALDLTAGLQPFPYSEARGKDAASGATPELERAPALDPREALALRDAGRREGEAQARQEYDQQLEHARENIRAAISGFARERQAYYKKIEPEVVRLALGIARKILPREAQIDGFFLAGLVRIALEKLEHSTKVKVRVHPDHGVDCRAFFARNLDPQHVPEVLEDASVPLEHSVLETDLGTTELGIEPQLKEIELGLMDLLAQRPNPAE